MFATQAALGNVFPPDVLAEIDSFRRRRVRRAKTAHRRQELYLVQKWCQALRRKMAASGIAVFIPYAVAWNFEDERLRGGIRWLYAFFRQHGY